MVQSCLYQLFVIWVLLFGHIPIVRVCFCAEKINSKRLLRPQMHSEPSKTTLHTVEQVTIPISSFQPVTCARDKTMIMCDE